jgi:hypothetical protein
MLLNMLAGSVLIRKDQIFGERFNQV